MAAVLPWLQWCHGHSLALAAVHLSDVKSGSTPVGGLVKSGRKWTKEKGRGLD